MFHPRVRMSLLVAVALVVGAFVLRTLLRGPSFDLGDALVLGMFAIVLAVVAFVRSWTARHDAEERGALDANAAEGTDDTPSTDRPTE